MTDGQASAALDRLPWLQDEPKAALREDGRRGSRQRSVLWLLAPLFLIAVGLLAYRAGLPEWLRSARPSPEQSPSEGAAATVTLPAPIDNPLQAPAAHPQATAPANRPADSPQIRHGRLVLRRVHAPAIELDNEPVVAENEAERAAPPPEPPLQYWPVQTSAGTTGRMVRIGTFASRRQAKKGWKRVVKIYPGIQRIPTLVVAKPSLRDGRDYYRLQMGTTSQAQSAVLCQRMRIIGLSCVVVGLGDGVQ